jgi:dTMP kinase
VYPKFIVFEGLDGSGTTTQAELLRQYFVNILNLPAIVTAEPSNGPIGNLIRQGFRQRLHFTDNQSHFDQQMAYLFAADRFDHLYNDSDGVLKTIADGVTVISTRYYFSSLAYHCGSEDDFSLVRKLNEIFPFPDLVIYIDVPLKVSLSRLESRLHKDSYENEKKLERVKENYNNIFNEYSSELIRVDGTSSIESVHQAIVSYIVSMENGA